MKGEMCKVLSALKSIMNHQLTWKKEKTLENGTHEGKQEADWKMHTGEVKGGKDGSEQKRAASMDGEMRKWRRTKAEEESFSKESFVLVRNK